MPQKTRREKQEASSRRQFRIIMHEHVSPHVIEAQKTAVTESITQHKKSDIDESPALKNYLISDLRKSLLLITGIFALEILLYFVRIGYQS